MKLYRIKTTTQLKGRSSSSISKYGWKTEAQALKSAGFLAEAMPNNTYSVVYQ